MSSSFTIFSDDIIEQYRQLAPDAHRDIIRFYETHKHSLPQLEIKDYIEIELGYTNALFEVGRYEPFLASCQFLLESLIYYSIKLVNGEDVYEKLLFRKAAAHYHMLEFGPAEKVLWELLKMNPDHQPAAFLLRRVLIATHPEYLKIARAVSIFLFLLAATIIAIELLVIKPFFALWTTRVETIRLSVFGGGLGFLLISEITHRLKSYYLVNQKLKEFRVTKNNQRTS